MAPRLGFEPRYTAPEAVVLPLDDLAKGSSSIMLDWLMGGRSPT